MEAKFFDSLRDGDSLCGTKLGLGLTGGDFWGRPYGCCTVYLAEPGFAEIELLSVQEVDAAEIEIPKECFAAKGPLSVLVRRVNCCGQEEFGLGGAVCLVRNNEGTLSQIPTNMIAGVETLYYGGRWCVKVLYLPQCKLGHKVRVFDGGDGQELVSENLLRPGYYRLRMLAPVQSDHLRITVADENEQTVFETNIAIVKREANSLVVCPSLGVKVS